MTFGEAVQNLVEQVLALADDRGEFPAIGQIDFVEAEDGSTSINLHLADENLNGGLPVVSNFELSDFLKDDVAAAIVFAGRLHVALANS